METKYVPTKNLWISLKKSLSTAHRNEVKLSIQHSDMASIHHHVEGGRGFFSVGKEEDGLSEMKVDSWYSWCFRNLVGVGSSLCCPNVAKRTAPYFPLCSSAHSVQNFYDRVSDLRSDWSLPTLVVYMSHQTKYVCSMYVWYQSLSTPWRLHCPWAWPSDPTDHSPGSGFSGFGGTPPNSQWRGYVDVAGKMKKLADFFMICMRPRKKNQ